MKIINDMNMVLKIQTHMKYTKFNIKEGFQSRELQISVLVGTYKRRMCEACVAYFVEKASYILFTALYIIYNQRMKKEKI